MTRGVWMGSAGKHQGGGAVGGGENTEMVWDGKL